jgi:hypothetical protein
MHKALSSKHSTAEKRRGKHVKMLKGMIDWVIANVFHVSRDLDIN